MELQANEAGLARLLPPWARSGDETNRDLLIAGKLRTIARIPQSTPRAFAALVRSRCEEVPWLAEFTTSLTSARKFSVDDALAEALATLGAGEDHLFLTPDARSAVFWPHHGDVGVARLDAPGWYAFEMIRLVGRAPLLWSRRAEEPRLARRLRYLRFALDRSDLAGRSSLDHLGDADPVVRSWTAAALATHPDEDAEAVRTAARSAWPHPWLLFALDRLGECEELERLAESDDPDIRLSARGILSR